MAESRETFLVTSRQIYRRMRFVGILVISGLLLFACSPPAITATKPHSFPQQTFHSSDVQRLVVEIDIGLVMIEGHSGDSLRINGTTTFPKQIDFEVYESQGEVRIRAQADGSLPNTMEDPALVIRTLIPRDIEVQVEADYSIVELQALTNPVFVSTIAGDISANSVSGVIWLKSALGGVTLQHGEGDLHLISESGHITINSSQGKISATTIMGDIKYQGTPSALDDIHIETDHGEVDIQLGESTNVDIGIQTISGNVVCTVPNLGTLLQGCSGTIGKGEGRLFVRTVTGKVLLRTNTD
jgi:hypothetical protein